MLEQLDGTIALAEIERGLQGLGERWLARARDLSEFFGRWERGWNSHDLELLCALVTDDIVWDDPAMLGETVHGRDEFRAFSELFFRAFPDVHLEGTGALYLAVEGDALALPWRMTGTFSGELSAWGKRFGPEPPTIAPTGRRFQTEGVDLYEFRDGLISRWTIVYDLLSFSNQIGLLGQAKSG
jgi:steroid delta-isomerase-like uncharacterized protein